MLILLCLHTTPKIPGVLLTKPCLDNLNNLILLTYLTLPSLVTTLVTWLLIIVVLHLPVIFLITISLLMNFRPQTRNFPLLLLISTQLTICCATLKPTQLLVTMIYRLNF